MEDGSFTSHDITVTETLGPMCKGCGHRGGQHRAAYTIGDRTWPACPGEEYDPADVAIFEAAQAAEQR